ncbi:MAG TPA: MBG domain-containing protein, partial [Vineibacter sp.]|nr:MBG domain-containing protein [Vineibacter sp.]
HFTGAVSGSVIVGGLTGLFSAGSVITQAYVAGTVSGITRVGGLVGNILDGASITQAYASGRVTAAIRSGGVAGYYDSGEPRPGTASAVYWDTQTTGQANAVGELIGVAPPAIGLTTAQARTSPSYASFDFTNTWFQTADMRPIGRWEAARAVNGVIAISTLNQLQLMAANPGASYALDRDIDARASSGSNAAGIYTPSGFVPVGAISGSGFTGALNGMDHVIDGLTISRSSASGVGLFGAVGYGGNVSNLGLTNVTVVGATATGGIAGVNNGVLNRTYVTGAVTGANSVGGLVGMNTGVIVYSYTDTAVRGTQETGGLIGSNNGAVQYTYAIGSVNGSGGASTGGLVGRNTTGSGVVDHSYASGAVTGTIATGGLVGTNEATVINSFWDMGTTGQSTSAGGTGLTTAQARVSSSYAGWNFQSVWFQADGSTRPIGRWEMAAPVNGVTTISNLHQLQLIGGQLDGRYVLDRNIDATPTSGANPAGIWDASGFNPLGSAVAVGFSGTFDGQGHVITGLTINRPTTSQVGLFGYTSDATIRRVGLVGGQVTGQDSVGALVGRAYGSTISDTFASTAVSGINRVGGLLGENNGTWGGGDVMRSFATGTVTATGQTVGGFVGWNSNATISQSYATGTVTNTGGTVIGGFAGWNAGTIRQAYATGAAAGGTTVGGFVGLNGGALDQVYSTGAVTGTGGLGGLVGARQAGGTATAAYWNTETSGRSTSQGGTGRTSAAMQTQAGFAGFDWAVWSPPDTTYRPELFGVSGVVGVSANMTRYYGDANPTTSGYVGAGYWNTITSGGSLSTTATATSGVGLYGMTVSGVAGTFTATGGASRIVYLGGSLYVAPRPITVTARGQSRAYGDANPALVYDITVGSLVNGDSLAGALATTATGTSNVGLYGITQGTLSASSNYALTYVGADLEVTRRALTVTADAQTRVYGDANPALTYGITSGSLVNGDGLSGGLTTSADGRFGVGAYAITQGSLAASSNYALTYVGADLTITPRQIEVTADAQSRPYGNANPVLTYRITGGSLVNDDTLSGAVTTDAHSGSSVGAYAITRGTLAASANYALTYVGADLTVTSRSITVTADAQSRVYGDANPALTYRITSGSLAGGDTLDGQLATSAGPTSGVGRYSIERGSLSSNPNYAFTYVGADLTVTQRPITVTADAQSRVYGDANPALTHRVTEGSLVNGDALSGDLATTANGASNIGAYAITQGTLAASPNYALTYVGADLAVTPRPITVTGDTLSRAYGDANPALTYAVTSGSLVNGDSLTGALATAATSTSNVGDYVITQGTLAASANYALTYSKATLSVTQRPITVTADALSRIYGDANPALTYRITAGSLVNGDGLSGAVTTDANATSSVGAYAISQGTLAASSNYALTYVAADLTVMSRAITITADAQSRVYGDANPALTYRITSGALVNGDTLEGQLVTGAGALSNVGRYGIERGSLSPNPNYALTYVGADLTVTPRPITVTADARSRVYGDGNPALTWAITSGNQMNEDHLTGGLATAATGTSGVGVYAIMQGTLAASPNYAVSYVGADLTITPRPIAVRADAQSRIYGNANPALTYAVTSEGGLVNGDTLSGALATTATATSDVGTYAISQGTLGSPNYALTFTGADLAITPRPIMVTAQAASRVYGDDANAFAFTTGDRGAGVAVVGALSSAASVTSGIGIYAIGQGTVTDVNNPNYRITYVGADLTITPRPITVTADSQSVTSGRALPPLTYRVGGRGLVNSDTLSGDLATEATTASAPGAYAIGQGTLAASVNYQMTFVPGTLTVVPAATATADLASMIDRTIRANNVQWRPFSSVLNEVAAAQSAVGHGVLVEDPRFSGRFFCLGAPALSSCGSAPR